MAKRMRIAVTGLSKSGKTVFLVSLLNHLLSGRNQLFENNPYVKGKRISASIIESDSNEHNPFRYKDYLELLKQDPPQWPQRTDDITELRLNVRIYTSSNAEYRNYVVELVDYPGEQLLDLPMMAQTFTQWSQAILDKVQGNQQRQALAAKWLEYMDVLSAKPQIQQSDERLLIDGYGKYLLACREAGLEHKVQPAMMVMNLRHPNPEYEPFCPLSKDLVQKNPQLAEAMAARFERYKEKVIVPFFAKMHQATHQVVLVDIMRILNKGEDSYKDIHTCIKEILAAFGYGKPGFMKILLAYLLGGPFGLMSNIFKQTWIKRILFIAPKADQATAYSRAHTKDLLRNLVRDTLHELHGKVKEKDVSFLVVAANRATKDAHRILDGKRVSALEGVVKGKRELGHRIIFPGEVPYEWPREPWDTSQFEFTDFEPRRLPDRHDVTLPHINMDEVIINLFRELLK